MSESPSVHISVSGLVDTRRAADLLARVRSALRNNHEHIVLSLSDDARIHSDALLAYLLTVRDYCRAKGHELSIHGGHPSCRDLCRLIGLQEAE